MKAIWIDHGIITNIVVNEACAGFPQVSILTNDDVDARNMHPGYRMDLRAALGLAFAFPMIDALEELLRKIRPYERVKGSADADYEPERRNAFKPKLASS